MTPRIETFKETKLVGKRIVTSFAKDKTVELWKSFSPRKREITNNVDSNLYAVDIYPSTDFFEKFNPNTLYEKWAAVKVSYFDEIPNGMEQLIIPKGLYAVFTYKGKPSQAHKTFQYIYGVWLPNSAYNMDKRPYFALMGDKYRGDHPDSEEEFWIPVIAK